MFIWQFSHTEYFSGGEVKILASLGAEWHKIVRGFFK